MKLRPMLAAVLATATTVTTLGVVSALAPAYADPDSRAGVVAERPRDAAIHAVDGEVRSVAQVGSTVVMGGNFTKVGPVTRGAAGVISIAGRSFGTSFPDVNGTVYAAAPDGAGGWYLGGDFASVGGQGRANVARVDATGAVTSFNPAPNGPVYRLVVAPDGDLIIGGNFTQAAGAAAGSVARVTNSGALVWGATVSGAVRALGVSGDGSRLYIGGDFSKIAGLTVRRLAALSAATGAQDTGWVPGLPNMTVSDLVVRT